MSRGSASSDSATRIAIHIARGRGANLVGLAIVDEPDIRAGAATGFGGSSFKHERDEALLADAHKQAADWLALFERRCRDAKVPAQALEIVGRPAASILAETEKRDLTVIGRDANFRFETDEDDQQTQEAILHRAARPVLLVPETASAELGKTVVIAYDGSGAAKRAIASFAASGLAESRVVHVATVDDNGAEAWEMANRAVQMLKSLGVEARPKNIVSPLSNIDALFAFATQIGAGLMVMGAFAHSPGAAVSRLRDARPRREDNHPALPPALNPPDMNPLDAAATDPRAGTPGWSVIPFVAYLVLIAVIPLFFGRLWEKNRNKLALAVLMSVPVVVYLVGHAASGGEMLLRTGIDYVSFMALLGALFAISGGICLRGSLAGTPLVNTSFLALGPCSAASWARPARPRCSSVRCSAPTSSGTGPRTSSCFSSLSSRTAQVS